MSNCLQNNRIIIFITSILYHNLGGCARAFLFICQILISSGRTVWKVADIDGKITDGIVSQRRCRVRGEVWRAEFDEWRDV